MASTSGAISEKVFESGSIGKHDGPIEIQFRRKEQQEYSCVVSFSKGHMRVDEILRRCRDHLNCMSELQLQRESRIELYSAASAGAVGERVINDESLLTKLNCHDTIDFTPGSKDLKKSFYLSQPFSSSPLSRPFRLLFPPDPSQLAIPE